MFFVKKFFIKRALTNALNTNRRVTLPNPEKPLSFQLVLDDTSDLEYENYLKLLKTHFKVESLAVFIVSRKKPPVLSADKQILFFAPASVSLMGKIRDESLRKQLEKSSHVCLDFLKNQSLLGNFLLVSLMSDFRVNFGDDANADLNLKLDKSADYTAKMVQLKKYLINLNGK